MTVPDLPSAVSDKLVWNWRTVLQKAWSIKINIMLALASAADAAVAYAIDGRFSASILVAVVSLIASGSRLVAQKGLSE